MKKLLISAAAACLMGTAAMAHTVTFGWTDNGNGTVTLWNEHWHGNLSFPCINNCSDNGGLTISGDGSGSAASYGLNAYTVQWAGALNDTDRDDMIADGTLLGYMDDPGNSGGGTYDDWLFTAPLAIGDGSWWFFTGTNCCTDTMTNPVLVTLSGIGSVDPGTGPGSGPNVVPLPASSLLLLGGLGGIAALRRRRKS